MRSKVLTAAADGSFQIPGGVAARIGSGAPGATVAYPLVGRAEDGQDTPVVFFDNGPVPLPQSPSGGGARTPTITFPAGTVPAGQLLAYIVAVTQEEAVILAAGTSPISSDSSGRVVVTGPVAPGVAPPANPLDIAWDGTLARRLKTDASGVLQTASAPGDSTKASYGEEIIIQAGGMAAASPQWSLRATTKLIRIRECRVVWPGKQTAGANANFNLRIITALSSEPADVYTPYKLDQSDVAMTGVTSVDPVVQTPLAYLHSFVVWVPAANAGTDAAPVGYIADPGNSKPIIIRPGQIFAFALLSLGAGYDGNAHVHVEWTEE